MYARYVSMKLRHNSQSDLAQTIETEVLPLLRKQPGFEDAITFVDPTGRDAFAVSLWDTKESAEAYGRSAYPEVTMRLSKLIHGTPQVRSYEVVNSTIHEIAAKSKAA